LGEGLLNILLVYPADDDSLEDFIESTIHAPSLHVTAAQENDTMDDSLFLPDNVNLVPPNEAHLQLILGRVQTNFFAVPEEHDLTRRFSTEGLLLWEKYFAPHMHGPADHNNTSVVDIPVSWFNFITLMLLTPKKFDWAKGFLSSQLWNILKEPMIAEDTIKFVIPDKCVTTKAPLYLAITDVEDLDNPITTEESALITPKRKRREGKCALIETEVRRSPRLVLLNDGYKNHVNCSDKQCLTCNAAPPIINSKVVKNLVMSFCKVPEETVEKRILKKSKIPGGDDKSAGPPGAIGSKKTKSTSTSSQSKAIEKGQDKAGGMAQQAEKKAPK
jgi:hypothetical protein